MWIRATMVLVIATQQLLLANLAVTSAAEVESLPVNLEQGEDGGEENTFVADYLGEQGEFEVEPDPPFLGREWVEALEVVFDKMCADWDAKEERGENADDGYYHPRKGARHLNPAFDLTSSGTTERPWDPVRLAAFAREQGELNITHYTPDHRVGHDNMPRHWTDEEPAAAGIKEDNQWAALATHGSEAWTNKSTMSLQGSMDANTDPWFKSNQDTDTGHSVESTCEWINKEFEDRIQEKLRQLEKICKEENFARKNNDSSYFAERSAAPEEDMLHYNYVTKPGSMTTANRRRTANFASNEWVNNANFLPSQEYNPGSAAMVWGFRAETSETLGTIACGSLTQKQAGYTGFTDAGGDENHEFRDHSTSDEPEGNPDQWESFIRAPALGLSQLGLRPLHPAVGAFRAPSQRPAAACGQRPVALAGAASAPLRMCLRGVAGAAAGGKGGGGGGGRPCVFGWKLQHTAGVGPGHASVPLV